MDTTKILVEALRLGFYDDRRVKPGVRFVLKEPHHYSHRWMKLIEDPDKELENGKKERPAKVENKVVAKRRPAPKSNARKSDEEVI